MEKRCPQCNYAFEYVPGETAFCPDCGADLSSENSSPPVVAESPSPVSADGSVSDEKNAGENLFANVDFVSIFNDKNKSEQKAQGIEQKLEDIDRKIEIADNLIDAKDAPNSLQEEPKAGFCSYLEAEFNRNVFFLNGSESVIKLRLTPRSKELRDVLVFMEIGSSRECRRVNVNEIIQIDHPFLLNIPYTPDQHSGQLLMTFYIGCRTDKEIINYSFTVESKVYDPRQSSQSLGRQIVINTTYQAGNNATIDTSMSATGAAEISNRSTIEDAIRSIGHEPNAYELIDKLNELPPFFEHKALQATKWRPESHLVAGKAYLADTLRLEWNNVSIILIGKRCVKLGRDAGKVDLVVRTGRGKLAPTEWPNSTVSRYHAEILYCDDSVSLFDHSSYGTYIDGCKPGSKGIPIPRTANIEFGDIRWRMNMQRCDMRPDQPICQNCMAGKIKCVTMSRTDDEPEYYVLLWECCELGRIIGELSDWSVFFRNNAFFIRTPDQKFCYLRPGQVVKCDNQEIKVTYFENFQ